MDLPPGNKFFRSTDKHTPIPSCHRAFSAGPPAYLQHHCGDDPARWHQLLVNTPFPQPYRSIRTRLTSSLHFSTNLPDCLVCVSGGRGMRANIPHATRHPQCVHKGLPIRTTRTQQPLSLCKSPRSSHSKRTGRWDSTTASANGHHHPASHNASSPSSASTRSKGLLPSCCANVSLRPSLCPPAPAQTGPFDLQA